MYIVKADQSDNKEIFIRADKVLIHDTSLAVLFYKDDKLVAMFKNPYHFYEVAT